MQSTKIITAKVKRIELTTPRGLVIRGTIIVEAHMNVWSTASNRYAEVVRVSHVCCLTSVAEHQISWTSLSWANRHLITKALEDKALAA